MNRSVPRIGGRPGQVSIAPQDTTERTCACGGEIFRMGYRIRILPSVSPKNPTGKDVTIKVETFLCGKCGTELK